MIGRRYGERLSYNEVNRQVSEGISRVAIGAAVVGIETVADHFIDIPETVETLALGGAGYYLLSGAISFARGQYHRFKGDFTR